MAPGLEAGSKRKAFDDNPLAATSKKVKLDQVRPGASAKRKDYERGEEVTGGLRIIRAPSAQPSSQQSHFPDPPPPLLRDSAPAPHPPSKKPRLASAPPVAGPSRPPSRSKTPLSQHPPAIDDARALEDEADNRRRQARAQKVIDPTITFPLPANQSRGKTRDISVPLLDQPETPQIQRNRAMRDGLPLNSKRGVSREPDSVQKSRTGRDSQSRSRSSIRGKRISDATPGLIVHPHHSIMDASLYKHIDVDLPDADRLRQLLIWSSSRASDACLRPEATARISSKGTQLLRNVQQDVVRLLATKAMDIWSPPSQDTAQTKDGLVENEQNVSNRSWEVVYSDHIQRAQDEDEAWKQVDHYYDNLFKKERAKLDKLDSDRLSAKALGKQRAKDDFDPDQVRQEHKLNDRLRAGMALAKSVLDGADSARHAELERRVGLVEFKLDQLHSYANFAKATAYAAERVLDQRFALLSAILTARSNPFQRSTLESEPGSGSQLLSTYAPREDVGRPDPHELLRALTRIDLERPPTKVGDAARRAAREVQRVEESGVGSVGDRKLTGIPSTQTPRKTPGTPRRGATPIRDKSVR